MGAPSLSVIIPAFNEEARLPPYLSSIVAYLSQRGGEWEVIVVDDGSRDATQAVVRAVMATCPSVRLIPLSDNRGKGAAVRAGMLAATGVLRLFCDADGATPIAEVQRLERALSAGADVAIGSRAIRGRDTRVEGTLHRKVIGTVYNRLVRLIAVPGLHDTQCGFKLFKGEVAERVFAAQRLSGFGFDVETLFLARKWGYVLREVPVNWRDRPGGKVRLLRDSIRMFLDLVKLRRSWAAGDYRVPTEGLRRAAGAP